eukprot:TRINITY_DN11466_c0_g1_i1.p1 TRINITY_DN11466_c0_g1~~TRINITY_DN11466_c0_g1_i1.p1  ORF type:complete len:556 (-),score=151.25 TRINITY_DN11466_c0_g1_i1:160-1626(-)
MVDDDLSTKKGKKDKSAGRQRGFILRAQVEESAVSRVVPWFKDAAKKLLDCSAVSRIDCDEAANLKKKKKNEKAERVANAGNFANLGANECRVETPCRIRHFAHGPGYRVEVAEGSVMQRLHMFTCGKEIPQKDWLALLLAALESTGSHVMLVKRSAKASNEEGTSGDAAQPAPGAEEADADVKIAIRKDKAQQDENSWLQTMMGGCMIDDDGNEEQAEQGAPVVSQEQKAKVNIKVQENAKEDSSRGQAGYTSSRWDALDPSRSHTGEGSKKGRPAGSQQQAQGQSWYPQVRSGKQDQSKPHQKQQQQQQHQQNRQQQQQQQQQQQPKQQKQQQPKQQQQQSQQQQQQWESQNWWQEQEWQSEQQQRSAPSTAPWAWVNGLHQAQGASAVAEPVKKEARPASEAWQSSWNESASWNEPAWQENPSTEKTSENRTNRWQRGQAQNQVQECGECGRGRPLKFYLDSDDGGWYCRKCWVDFYNAEPPNKA